MRSSAARAEATITPALAHLWRPRMTLAVDRRVTIEEKGRHGTVT